MSAPEWCGACSWDGWYQRKTSDGKVYAERCECWRARLAAGVLGERRESGKVEAA